MNKQLVRTIVLWVAAACLLTGAVAASGPPKPADKRPAGRPATPFDMTAEDFFALGKADRPIDAQKVDHKLLAAALFHETNVRRREKGKPPLRHDPRLDAAARMQAASMAEHNYLAHTNPHRSEHRTASDRALSAGFKFRFLAENVANHFDIQYQAGKKVYQAEGGSGFSYRPGGPPIPRHTYHTFASALLSQWMDSPGHRRNILSDQPEWFGSDCRLRREKSGMDKFYCVQLFGTGDEKNY